MSETTNSIPILCGGRIYQSPLDAAWGRLFQKAGRMTQYCETGFALPDGTVFTPKFAIRSLGRYVTVAGNVVRPRVCYGMNAIAQKQNMPTALVKGPTDSATIIFFDGKEPAPGWERASDPAPHFTSNIVATHGADEALSVLLRPEPGLPYEFTFPRLLRELPLPAEPAPEETALLAAAFPPKIVII